MANIVYNEYKAKLVTQTIAAFTPANSSKFGVMLVDSTYTPTETDTVATVVAKELTATGTDYERKALTNVSTSTVTVATTTSDDYYKVDADDCAFGPNVSLTASGAVIFELADTNGLTTGTPKSIITFVDFGSSKTSDNGDFTVVWNANGILNYKQGA